MFKLNMDTVYLFPLNQSLTLNKIPLPYHIFEPKYKKMVNAALEENKRICVLPSANDYRKTTCIAGIPVLLQRYEDGRMDIVITGVEKVKLIKEIQDYPFLEYSYEPVHESKKIDNKDDYLLILDLLKKKLMSQPHYDSQKEQFDKILEDHEMVINYSILLLLSNIEDKSAVMQLNDFDKKIAQLIELLAPKDFDLFDHINLLKKPT
tara:strand:- start:25864 stop:26484 length:621 start_codon:yes stop_codon:yes gene_type:complete